MHTRLPHLHTLTNMPTAGVTLLNENNNMTNNKGRRIETNFEGWSNLLFCNFSLLLAKCNTIN